MTETNSAPETNDLKLPMDCATSCPHCKSTKKLGESLLAQLAKSTKTKELLVKDLYFPVMTGATIASSILDPNGITLALALKVHVEVCGSCFTMYCTKIESFGIPIGMQQMPKMPKR